MKPTIQKVGNNTALVFPDFLALTAFVREVLFPKLGERGIENIWSDVNRPHPKKSTEWQLLFSSR